MEIYNIKIKEKIHTIKRKNNLDKYLEWAENHTSALETYPHIDIKIKKMFISGHQTKCERSFSVWVPHENDRGDAKLLRKNQWRKH